MDPNDEATRSSWKNTPMSETRAPLLFERAFSAEEHRLLAKGLVPREMEDKWFIFLEAGWLHFHRSWTGLCIYSARLAPDGAGGYAAAEAWVNRDPTQYTAIDDAYDARLLAFLVDRLLLRRDVPFPHRETVPVAKAPLLVNHVVGYARPSNDE